MIKEHLKKILFDKIKPGANIAIFGAGDVGVKMYHDIKKYRNDVNIKCFIDTFKTGTVEGVGIFPFSQINTLKDIDLVVSSTRRDYSLVMNIFQYYNIDFLPQERFCDFYYKNNNEFLNDENLDKILNMLDEEKDRELLKLVYSSRTCMVNDAMDEYAVKNHNIRKYYNARNIYKQYVDRLVLDKIKIIYDLGFFDGRNFLAYDKFMPNLEKIYAFEAIYDIAKNPAMDAVLKRGGKVEIINSAVADKDGEAVFCLNNALLSGSVLKGVSTKKHDTEKYSDLEKKVKVTSIDNYFSNNNIKAPDLIKMDIEGAELPAIKGAMGVINKFRPQLAISIYHSDFDFVNIPIFLSENLTDYAYKLGHYSRDNSETVLYAIPKEYL